jgi:hypothetical protein
MKISAKRQKQTSTFFPSSTQREEAKRRIMETVSGWLEVRINEVFEMADDGGTGGIIWDNLNEVRCAISGCLSDDLDCDLGERVEEILEDELLHPKESPSERADEPE